MQAHQQPINPATDLRAAAHALRQTTQPQQRVAPPQETGERLATIARGEDEELRVVWTEYQGKPYVQLRVWKRGSDGGWWPDKTRGLTVRVRELPAFAEGIAAALEAADQAGRGVPVEGGGRP